MFASASRGPLFYAGPVTDATAAAIAGELALLDPSVRANPDAAARLIDPDFIEVGQSGVLWDRDAILAEFGKTSRLPPSSPARKRMLAIPRPFAFDSRPEEMP